MEPAFGCYRTLLDIELAMRLIHADPSDRKAKLLAAANYHFGAKLSQKQLHHPTTRSALEAIAGARNEVVARARHWSRTLEKDFAEVKEELLANMAKGRRWHGFKNAEEAFEAVRAPGDFHEYSVHSEFVHGTNPEWDYVAMEEGKPMLRAVPSPSIREGLSVVLLTAARQNLVTAHFVEDEAFSERPVAPTRGQLEHAVDLINQAMRFVEMSGPAGTSPS